MSTVTLFNPLGEIVSHAQMSEVNARKAQVEVHDNGVRCDITICAWCPDYAADNSLTLSHGICPVCAKRMEEE